MGTTPRQLLQASMDEFLPTGGQRTCTQLTSVQSQGHKKGTNPDRHGSKGIHLLNGKAHFYNTLHH